MIAMVMAEKVIEGMDGGGDGDQGRSGGGRSRSTCRQP